jgi:hypothetical protein
VNVRSLILSATLLAAATQGAEVVNLRCEGRLDPIGIDTAQPALSWNIDSSLRGDLQTEYQIMVASSQAGLAAGKGDLWDTGGISSDQSLYVPYAGKSLTSLETCWWKVRIWDRHGHPTAWSKPAEWTTALLAASDWKAQWVTASHWFMPPEYRPSGFETIPAGRPDYVCWAQVDLGSAMPIDTVKLFPNGVERFPRRFRIEAADDVDFDSPKTIADQSGADFNPGNGKDPLEFPAHGLVARRVRILILKSPPSAWNPRHPADQKYQSVIRQMEVWSGGRNAALMRPTLESGHQWNTGHSAFMVDGMPSAMDGGQCPPGACPTTAAPLLRKQFTLALAPQRALLCYAALGMADLTINGSKVGDAVLDPPFTDYTKRVLYRIYDVTALLHIGKNVIGATLGNGFFSTPGRGFGERQNGDGPPALLAQLQVEMPGGLRTCITSDPTWKWSTGEITFNDVWKGYAEDRRLAKPGWDRPGYEDAKWQTVATRPPIGGALHAVEGPPVRVMGTLKPGHVTGQTAYFDVLTSGWPVITVNGKAGQVIAMQGDCGVNPVRFTLATDGVTVLEPRFIYYSGPHHMDVTGLTSPLTASMIGFREIHADLEVTGTFGCSNSFLNRIYEALVRTHQNYNLEHPLDPMREKQGWTQDAETMLDTAAYLTDVSGLYHKWWEDMVDNQSPNGLLGSVVPVVGRQVDDWNCPWWSGMVVWIPWEHYLYYGDKRLLAEAYEPMKKYVEYLDHLAATGGGTRALDYPDPHHFLDPNAARAHLLIWNGASDWLNPEKLPPSPLLNMAAWYDYARIVGKTASMLGKTADAARFATMADQIRQRTNSTYLNLKTGQYLNQLNNQTAQVMPLALGLVPDEDQKLTYQCLLDAIHADADHQGTGFVGLPYLLQTLTDHYETALTNRMINWQNYPGWNQLIHDGVLAETWRGGGAQMPSCGGAIGMWLYQSVLGIRPDPAAPGFRHFILAPQPDPATGLTSAHGWYRSLYGKILSEWNLRDGLFRFHAVIPVNTTATIRIPTTKPGSVLENAIPVSRAPGLKIVETTPDALFVSAPGGDYHFTAQ